MLAKRFPRLAEDERLAIYHDAWARVLAKWKRGEKIESLRAYLLATTGAEALNVLSRGRVPTPVGPDDPRLAALADEAPPVDEQIVTRDQARIARVLLDTLDERQRDVLKLRWDLQLSGAEVRAALGLSERQYRRLAEEGAAALARRVEELESGQWSRRTRSLLVACLVEVTQDGERRSGIASRRQRAEAQQLLQSDPHVAALYAEVRRSVRGATALLPLPAFAWELDTGVFERLAAATLDLRAHFAQLIETSKQHATSIYVRAADPSLFTGAPRPGAAVIAVAGVLAVSGGAYGTYEATSATSNPTPPATASTPAAPLPPAARPVSSSKPKNTVPSPPQEPESSTPEPSTPPPPPPIQAPHQSSPQPPPTPQPTEFGFED